MWCEFHGKLIADKYLMRNWINIVTEATRFFGGFGAMPDHATTSKYMRGWCPYFALAAHDLYDFEIVSVYAHFAVKLPDGRFMDMRGIMTQDQFLDGLGGNEIYPMSRDELIAEIETGHYKCGYFYEPELAKAKRLIKKLKPRLEE